MHQWPEKAPVFGMSGMVPRARLLCTRDKLTPGIYATIKPAAMEKSMSFRTKINTVVLWYIVNHDMISETWTYPKNWNKQNYKDCSIWICCDIMW